MVTPAVDSGVCLEEVVEFGGARPVGSHWVGSVPSIWAVDSQDRWHPRGPAADRAARTLRCENGWRRPIPDDGHRRGGRKPRVAGSRWAPLGSSNPIDGTKAFTHGVPL